MPIPVEQGRQVYEAEQKVSFRGQTSAMKAHPSWIGQSPSGKDGEGTLNQITRITGGSANPSLGGLPPSFGVGESLST
jgi:hypothetical protein